MKSFSKYLVVFFLLVQVGCATVPKIDPMIRETLPSKKIAMSFNPMEKTILYMETEYRGLWLEYRDDTVTYDGVWDIESELPPIFVEEFSKMGLNLLPLDAEVYLPYQEQLITRYKATEKEGYDKTQRKHLGPVVAFYNDLDWIENYVAHKENLKAEGYDYLMEIYLVNILGNAPGAGFTAVGASLVFNLVDLNSNAAVWTSRLASHKTIKGGNLKNLEKDNQKLLRNAVKDGVKELFDKGVIHRSMGFGYVPATKNNASRR